MLMIKDQLVHGSLNMHETCHRDTQWIVRSFYNKSLIYRTTVVMKIDSSIWLHYPVRRYHRHISYLENYTVLLTDVFYTSRLSTRKTQGLWIMVIKQLQSSFESPTRHPHWSSGSGIFSRIWGSINKGTGLKLPQMWLPSCPLVIALVPFQCSNRNLQFIHRVPITMEKMPSHPSPFRNKALQAIWAAVF